MSNFKHFYKLQFNTLFTKNYSRYFHPCRRWEFCLVNRRKQKCKHKSDEKDSDDNSF